jgi:RNA polymerase sigma-70 factor, ECF subfamily
LEVSLDSQARLNTFLAGLERRAYRMVALAVGNGDDALDIVQDAMVAFVNKYASRPELEWTPLFYRILQNRITDWRRRTAIRSRLRIWFGWNKGSEEYVEDPIENMADTQGDPTDRKVLGDEIAAAVERAIAVLPLRQQQAFLLRAWEGLDTQQTALSMGCSQGSVKTHYSRAVHALRDLLEDFKP